MKFGGADFQSLTSREVPLGGVRGITVHRTLPHRARPTIGAWCFADHFGPTDEHMDMPPHPHIGLQTVTWLLAGRVRHRDSLGNDVVLRPGELNLMTSGDAVSHSEVSESDAEPLAGVQLWVALPDARRLGPADFEHVADLPRVDGPGWDGIVLVGEHSGAASRARVHTPLVGLQIRLTGPGARVDLEPGFEHGVLALDGPVLVDGIEVPHRGLHYLRPGRSGIDVSGPGRSVLLLGGEPFTSPLVMWWNFVGRDHDDIAEARHDWMAQPVGGRFGRVEGHDEQFVPAPEMATTRLRPRVPLRR